MALLTWSITSKSVNRSDHEVSWSPGGGASSINRDEIERPAVLGANTCPNAADGDVGRRATASRCTHSVAELIEPPLLSMSTRRSAHRDPMAEHQVTIASGSR